MENNSNIKWTCDDCGKHSKLSMVSDILKTVQTLNEKVEQCLQLIGRQDKKIDHQNNVINKLLSRNTLVQPQTNSTKTRPVTRSTTSIPTDATFSQKLQSSQKVNKQKAEVNQPEQKLESPSQQKVSTPDEQETITVSNEIVANHLKNCPRKKRNTTLEAVENRKWIFISQLKNTTTVEDVKKYLQDNDITILECHKLDIYHQNISAFKICVEEHVENEIYNENT